MYYIYIQKEFLTTENVNLDPRKGSRTPGEGLRWGGSGSGSPVEAREAPAAMRALSSVLSGLVGKPVLSPSCAQAPCWVRRRMEVQFLASP